MDAITRLDQEHPLQRAAVARGQQTWREAGQGQALVLLHGIGSGSLGWAAQLEAFAPHHRVLAWDAPGYGGSSPLAAAQPLAVDYVQALVDWLQPLHTGPMVLVGHSLGAIVAAAAAADGRLHVRSLLLASPAQGYGDAEPALREAHWRERLQLVRELGPAGLAASRAPRLCTPQAGAEVLNLVRWNMARVSQGGYEQAAHLLTHDVLRQHLKSVRAPVAVCCGDADRITPPAAAEQLAREIGVPFHRLPGAAHACYAEHPQAFNAVLRGFVDSPQACTHE